MKKNNKQNEKDTLKWIYSCAKPHLGRLILVMLINAFIACTGTVTALITKELLDSASGGNFDGLIRFSVICAVIAVLQIGLSVFLRYYTEKLRAKLDISFKKQLFGQQLTKSYPEIRAFHTGELINRLTGDVSVITDAVTSLPPTVISVTVRLVCAFSVLVIMQWQFAVVFAIGGIIIYVTTRLLRDKVKNLHKEMQKQEGRVRSFWQEVLENLLVVKSFGGEEMSVIKSSALQDEHYKVRMKKSLIGSLSSGANHSVMRFGYIFALVWCAYKMLIKQMSFGTLTAITSLVAQVQMPFSSLSGIMPRYYAAISSAERIMEIEELTDEASSDSSLTLPSYGEFEKISISNLDFAYDKTPVIKNFSFDIHKGDFVSVTGESGIGKSTLFKLLLAIYEKSGGSINFIYKGTSLPVGKLTRQMFAYVPQGNLLFSGTLRENLLFLAGEKTPEEIDFALTVACAKDFVDKLPAGLDSVISEGGMGLSEGQAQRLAVARAILSARDVLLFDEATSALDEKTEKQMLENIRNLTDKTCIMVTHKPAALEICNKNLHLS